MNMLLGLSLDHILVLRKHGCLWSSSSISINHHQWRIRIVASLFNYKVIQAFVNHWSHANLLHSICQWGVEKVGVILNQVLFIGIIIPETHNLVCRFLWRALRRGTLNLLLASSQITRCNLLKMISLICNGSSLAVRMAGWNLSTSEFFSHYL